MGTRSSILAWRIPWTEEPARLLSTGLQKSWTQLSSNTTKTSALGTLGLMNHIKLNSHVCHCVPHCTQRLVLIWKGALNIK